LSTFTFPDGRSVVLRPMYVLDELAFDDLAVLGEQMETARAELRDALAAVEAASDDGKAAATETAIERFESYQRAYQAQLRAVYDRMRDACESTSWGGELGVKVTSDELGQLSRRWRVASGDEELPPV
jgi:hypothetical protein